MNEDFESMTPTEPEKPPVETTSYQGREYNVVALFEHAETLPTEGMPLEELAPAVGPEHRYWEDTKGKPFGPYELLLDWEAAQQNPLWKEHVEKIKTIEIDHPIWLVREDGSDDLVIINGAHRLTKAFLEKRASIPTKFFDYLPDSALTKK